MLTLPGRSGRTCEGPTRRDWLAAGGLTAFGLGLPQLLRAAPTVPAGSFGRAKSCIVAFLFGAPAHQDTFDLKPNAPAEARGEFRPIDTTVAGVRVCEHLPLTAQQAHRFAQIRSVSHPDNTHTVAMHAMLTGHRHLQPQTNPRNHPTDFPCFGAAVRYLRPSNDPLPSGISLNAPANQVSAANHIFPGFFAGFLGSSYDPLFVPDNPAAADFRPFPTAEGEAARRLGDGRALLAAVDRRRACLDHAASVRSFDAFHERAFALVTSPRARQAFDLSREPATTRDRYGSSAFGQGLLLARRLVESGVRLVTVNWARDDAFWDTHSDNFGLLKRCLLPPFDRAFSALLEDLSQRGLLAETLVVVLGEFGRSPAVNNAAGREHWAACNTVLLAGAGVRGGLVYGASDRIAAYPVTPPVSPGDLSATIYHLLGIDPATELRDHLGRPLPLSPGQSLADRVS